MRFGYGPHPAHSSQPNSKHHSHASQSRMARQPSAPGASLARASLPGLHQGNQSLHGDTPGRQSAALRAVAARPDR